MWCCTPEKARRCRELRFLGGVEPYVRKDRVYRVDLHFLLVHCMSTFTATLLERLCLCGFFEPSEIPDPGPFYMTVTIDLRMIDDARLPLNFP